MVTSGFPCVFVYSSNALKLQARVCDREMSNILLMDSSPQLLSRRARRPINNNADLVADGVTPSFPLTSILVVDEVAGGGCLWAAGILLG